MRNYKRRKLGVPQIDTTLENNIKSKIETFAPVSLSAEGSETLKNDQAFKTINIGNINNPNNIIVGNAERSAGFYSIQNPNRKYFFAKSTVTFNFNGQLHIYQPFLRDIDPDNPYDPVFSSFNRLTSFPPRIVNSGILTGFVQSVPASGNFYLATTSANGGPWSNFVSGDPVLQKEFGVFYKEKDVYTNMGFARSGYVFGDYIDTFWWAQVNFNKGTQYFIAFDKSGELGHTGKWFGVTTSFIDYSSGAWALWTRNASLDTIKSLISLVATGNNQDENNIPTLGWSAVNYPNTKILINNQESYLLPITTGYRSTRVEIGGKEHYALITNNSFTNPNQGFYKIARTRRSYDVNHIYAKHSGQTLTVGNISGDVTPSGFFKVTYPHSYWNKSFGALRFDAIIVPELYAGTGDLVASGQRYVKGANDIIIISTGVSKKTIVYVSPAVVNTFSGFWSQRIITNRTPKIKIRNTASGIVTGFTDRLVSDLKSGSLLSVSSKDVYIPVKTDYTVTGVVSFVFDGKTYTVPTTEYYSNVPAAMLKTTESLINHPFYKLYEPIFRPGAFQPTWNGIIPSGTPFQIEIVRTQSNSYGLNDYQLSVYANNYFDTAVTQFGPSGNSVLTRKFDESNSNLALFGTFEGRKTVYDNISQDRANYIAEKRAYKIAYSKINGALWDKGLSKDNNKTRKIIKLFNRGSFPFRIYSYEYEVSPGVKSNNYYYGILTAGGLRQPNGDVITMEPTAIEQNVKWKREI